MKSIYQMLFNFSFYPLAFILLVSFTCLSVQAYGVSNKTVAKVHVNGSSGFYFKTHEPMKNPSNCSNGHPKATWINTHD